MAAPDLDPVQSSCLPSSPFRRCCLHRRSISRRATKGTGSHTLPNTGSRPPGSHAGAADPWEPARLFPRPPRGRATRADTASLVQMAAKSTPRAASAHFTHHWLAQKAPAGPSASVLNGCVLSRSRGTLACLLTPSSWEKAFRSSRRAALARARPAASFPSREGTGPFPLVCKSCGEDEDEDEDGVGGGGCHGPSPAPTPVSPLGRPEHSRDLPAWPNPSLLNLGEHAAIAPAGVLPPPQGPVLLGCEAPVRNQKEKSAFSLLCCHKY